MGNAEYMGNGYDVEKDNDCPIIYTECDRNSLRFWRSLGFAMVGMIDHRFFSRHYRSYSLLYHPNEGKLNSITSKLKQVFAEENTLHIDPMGLAFDFNEDNDDTGNVHFKWQYPMTNWMEFVRYSFRFGMISFVVQTIEDLLDIDDICFDINALYGQLSNYKWYEILVTVLKGMCLFVFLCCYLPLFVFVIVMRRFKLFAWDI